MMKNNARQSILQQLVAEDAVGQLRRRDGLMATLGSEGGELKLDWVEGVARLLADPAQLELVETEARNIRERGIRHMIWAGMGGSVIAVRVLYELGFCAGEHAVSASLSPEDSIAIYPLDSTDPAALNEIVRKIASTKKLALPEQEGAVPPALIRELLQDVMMVGVSMGMTSEEPITHLEWFTELLEQAQLRPAEHLLIMTLPGSYLDKFAHEHQVPTRPLQLDAGTGTGGRMSAPTTRVFLLPAALFLTSLAPAQPGRLRSVLQRAWDEYNLEQATSQSAEHPFVQLAAAMSDASSGGACRLLLGVPEGWHALIMWLEQLMEESLGKGGKGIVVFDDQALNRAAPGYRPKGMLRVQVVTEVTPAAEDDIFLLPQPFLAHNEPEERLAALAASFLGWQLSMALYGYLQHITFAGQPAVENYKARARALRTQPDPLQVVADWQSSLREGKLILLGPQGSIGQESGKQSVLLQGPGEKSSIAVAFADVLRKALAADDDRTQGQGKRAGLEYLDLTVNGEAPANLFSLLNEHVHTIGNTLIGVPIKLREAPAAYHSTAQSEMDGPPDLISLRLVARTSEASILGTYTNIFLHAQAVSTWQAMLESGHSCFLLIIDGTFEDAREPLGAMFSHVEERLRQ